MFTGSGSLDSGIQGQQVGLLGNGRNSFHNLTDFLGALPQLVNGFCRAVYYLGYTVNLIYCQLDSLITFHCCRVAGPGMFRNHICRPAQFLNRGHSIFDGIHRICYILLLLSYSTRSIGYGLGYLLRCLCRLMRAGGQFLRRRCQLFGGRTGGLHKGI